MKITKVLPIVLALMLVAPAIAAPEAESKKAESTQVLTVPKYIHISHDADNSVETATASFNSAYDEITLDNAMVTQFRVVTNNPDEKIKITATALAGGNPVNAIYGNDESVLRLVFTNNGTDKRAAAASSVENITGGTPQKAQNANAIAFALTPVITPDTASGATAPAASKKADGVEYALVNGAYDFKYTIAQTAIENTFSTHDTDGTYKATLTLSQLTTP